MSGKKKITGIALLIIGFSLFLIKTGFSVIFIEPISKLTGFALLEKLQNINPFYLNVSALFLIILGAVFLLFKEKEVRSEVKIIEKKLKKFEKGR